MLNSNRISVLRFCVLLVFLQSPLSQMIRAGVYRNQKDNKTAIRISFIPPANTIEVLYKQIKKKCTVIYRDDGKLKLSIDRKQISKKRGTSISKDNQLHLVAISKVELLDESSGDLWINLKEEKNLIYSSVRPRRYFLSILGQYKNEELTVVNWITHNIMQGVQHFYLLDNHTNDMTNALLQPYIAARLVTRYPAVTNHNQEGNLKEVLMRERLQEQTEWLIMCDFDEFYYGRSQQLSTVLLNLHEVDVVYTPWAMFGTNLTVHPADVRISNTLRQPASTNRYTLGKMIIRPAAVDIMHAMWKSVHTLSHPWNIENAKNPRVLIDTERIGLNHYRLQSWQYYNSSKALRGDSSRAEWESIRTVGYFQLNNENMTVNDDALRNIALHPPAFYHTERALALLASVSKGAAR